jgi:hypothetical protein
MFHKTSLISLALVIFLAIAVDARAEVVLSASSVVSAPPVLTGYPFERTIDQSGLAIGYVSGVTDFNTYIGLSPIHTYSETPNSFAASPTAVPQNVDYDLGGTYLVTKMAFWNYPFNTLGPVTSLDVYTANNAGFAGAFFAGSFLPADDATGVNTNQAQVFDLADSGARYVRLRITGQATLNQIGYSEVAFAVIPEPFTVGYIAVAAVTLLGTAGRTRRRSDCR